MVRTEFQSGQHKIDELRAYILELEQNIKDEKEAFLELARHAALVMHCDECERVRDDPLNCHDVDSHGGCIEKLTVFAHSKEGL